MSEQEPEAAPPTTPPTPDPDFPDPGRVELRASQPPPDVMFTTEEGS